jgi:hypothetical protein
MNEKAENSGEKKTPTEIMDLDLHIQKRKWTENKDH